MFTEKVSPWALELMGLLKDYLPADSYLAGGTALAMYLDHRSSFDLDIYSPQEFDERQQIQIFEKNIPDFKLISSSWQTILGGSRDTEISLFYYEYQLLEPTQSLNGFQIASLADLACMKIEAIGSRGLKRDFFDLYTICQQEGWDLGKIIDLTIKKYDRKASDIPHILKSLVYFEDAESKPERAIIIDDQWQKVREYFVQEVPQLAKELLK